MTLIKDDLEELFKPSTEVSNPYHKFKLLENPFPGRESNQTEVCTNQSEVKEAFAKRVRDFNSQDKRLRIDGLSGAGKTNMLHYFDRITNEARVNRYISHIYPIYVQASGEDYFFLHSQIVEKLWEISLLNLDILQKLNQSNRQQLMNTFPAAAEVLTALFSIFDGYLSFSFERNGDIFQRWFKGQRISTQDRKVLKIEQDINSASLAIKYLQGYLTVLKNLNICQGIVLLIDEFEYIFTPTLTRSKQSRYAQDIRHMLDTLDSQAFFVFAISPEARDLEKYPAVERRLGKTITLAPINNEDEAKEYVVDYLKAGREAYSRETKEELDENAQTDLRPLSEEVIRKVYNNLKRQFNNQDVLPGYFLPEVRSLTEEKVEAST